MGDAKTGDGYAIQSLDRAFAILELFSTESPRLSATQIAGQTGLNRVTAYRLCRALETLGYLRRDEENLYRLGIQAVALAHAAAASMDITQAAMPTLTALQRATGKTVNLATRNRSDIVYLARLRSADLLEIQLSVGSRIPIHASSLGKAICAHLPPAELDDVIAGLDFAARTSRTITTEKEFRRQIEKVREQGFALNIEELASNICGIAMPILDRSGYPVAAANIALTESLSAEEIVERYRDPLGDATREISSLLGHTLRAAVR